MLKPIFVRSGNNYDMFQATLESALRFTEGSRTVKSQKDEADINTIVRRFGVTGQLPQSARLPQYGDFDGIDNYRDALEAVAQAETEFMQIPPEIRARFHNNPGAFAEFATNPANLPELKKMGLATPDAPPAPIPAPPPV